jgi:hypothetical protein
MCLAGDDVGGHGGDGQLPDGNAVRFPGVGRRPDGPGLARVGVPLSWFFMPPTPDERREQGVAIRLDVPDAPGTGVDLALLLDLVFGEPHQEPIVGLRLEEYLDDPEPRPPTEGERRAADSAAHRLATLVRAGGDGIDQWQEQLREIASHLENLIALAGIAAWGDPDQAAEAKAQAEDLAEPRTRHEPPRSAPPAPARKRPRTA